jgi:hypothetical protein
LRAWKPDAYVFDRFETEMMGSIDANDSRYRPATPLLCPI